MNGMKSDVKNLGDLFVSYFPPGFEGCVLHLSQNKFRRRICAKELF